MQGFNRYHPPDFDWKKHATFNDYQGKHALGDRARKIDQGILIVRFELPFNVWCGSCDGHLGAGVRFNAEKRKVGNYLSTPIYGFTCKCASCGGKFELRTDPKNAAYVVHEGAKKQSTEWDPEDYGGHGVHDPDKPSTADADAFSQLEKTTEQKAVAKTAEQRLIDLYAYSGRTTEDPERLNRRLRDGFRTEKKARQRQEDADEEVRARYGLSERIALGPPDEDGGEGSMALATTSSAAGTVWKAEQAERDRRLLLAGRSLSETGSSSKSKGKARESHEGSVDRLRRSVLANTARRFHPFAPTPSAAGLSRSSASSLTLSSAFSSARSSASPHPPPSRGRTLLPPPKSRLAQARPKTAPPTSRSSPAARSGLVDYESD